MTHYPKLPIIPIVCLCLLLFFPSLSVKGACSGLLLWFNVVLPTLAPFIICTQMITALGGAELLMAPFGPLSKRLFRLSLSGSYILLCGLLCGYPLGAKMCADFKRRGAVSEEEASSLLAICNHPSPMFLLGYVRSQLPLPTSSALLLLCLYLPILPLSFLSRRLYAGRRKHSSAKIKLSQKNLRTVPSDSCLQKNEPNVTLEDAISSTCETMVIIGGYIMLFSILAQWIQTLPLLSLSSRALLTGMAEITTGIHSLCTSLPAAHTALPVICATAFGGLYGIFQTKSVIKDSGLSICHYIGWKALHTCFSCLTWLLLFRLF